MAFTVDELVPRSPYSPRETGFCPHCSMWGQFRETTVYTHRDEHVFRDERWNDWNNPVWQEIPIKLLDQHVRYMLIGSDAGLSAAADPIGYRYPAYSEEGNIVNSIDPRTLVSLEVASCENCGGVILTLGTLTDEYIEQMGESGDKNIYNHIKADQFVVWPLLGRLTRPTDPAIPKHIASEYLEAARLLKISPRASAAFARRCLEIVLTEQGIVGQPRNDLAGKIRVVLPNLPNELADQVDAIRHYGNLAVHGLAASGQIVEVEPDEAEWSLVVLKEVLDYYYVEPVQREKRTADNARRKKALDEKLQTLVKPKMRSKQED
jgi:hypothetical protein